MARAGVRWVVVGLVGAGLVVAVRTALFANPREDPETRFRYQLTVQVSLQQGLDHLKAGHHAAAVAVLEKPIALIDGNRQYLVALRDAYRGHIADLHKAGKQEEAAVFLGRLHILEPGGKAAAPVRKTNGPPERPTSAERTEIVPRAKVLDHGDDVFGDDNREEAHQARELITRADGAFRDRRYGPARALYEQANKAWPRGTDDCRDRWAYSILYAVVEEGNRPDARPVPELEKDIRRALALAPRLEAFGEKLLRQLRDRPAAPTVAVKHTPRKANTWAMAETTNFRVLHLQDDAFGERIARLVEGVRRDMGRRWFGDEGSKWTPRCDVYLYPTARDYAKATGMPDHSPGTSKVNLEGERIVFRRIDLRCDDRNLLAGTLPHETTHIVLAGRFGRHHVPRWADEGMAVLSEPRERIEMHLRNLPKHRGEGHLLAMTQLLRLEEYRDARSMGAFYAQSVSLVEFLVKRRDHVTFARFLREGLDRGYETALRSHYGIDGLAELDRQWRDHAFAGVATAGR